MLFERQKCLLALVDALGGNVGSLDFQKLLFLYCLEVEPSPSYDFVPYRFGGFSFTSYADKRRLIEQGFLSNEERFWQITPEGRAAARISSTTQIRINYFASRNSTLRGDALVAETYRRHPYYATRSEMAERVLVNDNLALLAIDAARPKPSTPGLCTIGYEGRSLERYLNQLLGAGVTLVCDVRRNAFSHKYGFSKGTLSKGCEGVGTQYEHLPELGIASSERKTLQTQADYDALFTAYERECLPHQSDALAKIHDWIKSGERVALTCFESQPNQCHRHCVAEAMERLFGVDCKAVHL